MSQQSGSRIVISPEYRPGLTGLKEFSHIQVIWGFDQTCPDSQGLVMPPAYRLLDHEVGVFATRSPYRPNPLALSCSRLLDLDITDGIFILDWIDADEGSTVFDLKPYHPSVDLVREYQMPEWCAHWPKSREASADFDWEKEFTF